MKVSHPIVFGHCVKVFYKDASGQLIDALTGTPEAAEPAEGADS